MADSRTTYAIYISMTTVLILQSISKVTGESVSACFNNTQKSLQLNCGSGYMLRITKAFYGYSPFGACHFQPGDCTQAEHEAYPCTGRDTCSINLPSGHFGQKIPLCDKYSSYFQVEYECEPVIVTADICRTPLLMSQSGYISTPRYPNSHRGHQDCTTKIVVAPSQKINLTIIDMDLQINGTYGCHDWMFAFNQYRSVTLCGRRTNEKVTSLDSNEITIRFQTDGMVNKKGFWIFYEAYPPLPPEIKTISTVRPPRTTRPPDPLTPGSTGIPVVKSTTKLKSKTKEKLPFVAIVAGVIGTLTFILIVLLVLLAIKWRRDKKHTTYRLKPKDVEYLDARNPAFRSSNGSEFQGVEIYYNC